VGGGHEAKGLPSGRRANETIKPRNNWNLTPINRRTRILLLKINIFVGKIT
jgi:hypothetical protein